MKKYNVGIIGAGFIADLMAEALVGIKDEVTPYAIASRDITRATAFAKKWGFGKSYGSYEELVKDPKVDLVYIATPHSHHLAHAKLCIEHGKAVLVEKAFTANEKQAKELIDLAESKGIFLTEAIWTRYLPARHIVNDLMKEIGEVKSIDAEFSQMLTHVPRLCEPALCGGALLDLGVYTLTFASMYFGDDIASVKSFCKKYPTGVDDTSEIIYTYRDGKKAVLRASLSTEWISNGTIVGEKGSIYVEGLNNYTQIRLHDANGNLVKECPIPPQVNGYEYEVLACKRAMSEGKLECEEMPHSETLEIMRQMDTLRTAWGVKYPFE